MSVTTNLTYAQALALPDPKYIWLDGSRVVVYTGVDIPNRVPEQIQMYQAEIVLTRHDLLATVEAAVAAAPEELQIRWKRSPIMLRNSPDVLAIATGLGWTSDFLDQLFIEAEGIA